MGIKDLIQETLASLAANKARSALTVLGIVVGIASVIAMLAIGAGAQSSITDSISSAGANQMTISYQMKTDDSGNIVWTGKTSLTDDDVATVAKSSYVKQAIPSVSSSSMTLAYQDNSSSASITGTTSDYFDAESLEIGSGGLFTDQDNESAAKVIVLGATTSEDLFGTGVNGVGRKVRVGTMIFTVAGVLQTKDSTTSNSDSSAYVPIKTAQRYMTGAGDVSAITAITKSTDDSDAAKADITGLLLTAHGISDADDADFKVSSMADLISTISSVTGTFISLLAAIAGISLVVGGIGIMNMMLTNVSERKREIGLRKALGAEEGSITLQFLSESIVLTMIGGVIGVLVGWILAAVAGLFMSITATLSMSSIALAAGVCIGIGLVFGYYPARQAARLNPIEALRFQ